MTHYKTCDSLVKVDLCQQFVTSVSGRFFCRHDEFLHMEAVSALIHLLSLTQDEPTATVNATGRCVFT